jgi:predicted nucleic acid-binding protein
MAGYLLDTNHLSAAIRKISPLRDRIRIAHRLGHRFATCWPVLCELEAGICQTARAEAYRRTLHALLMEIRIWAVDWDSVRVYGEVFKKLKKKGRVLSHVDLVLVALARQFKVKLLTADKDFQAAPEIKTENWLE